MTEAETDYPRRRRSRGGLRFLLALAVLPVLGGLAGLLVANISPVRYTAHSYVLITGASGSDVTAADIATAVARVATSESVLTADGSADQLLRASRDDRLTAAASPDAPLVDLGATAGTPGGAAALADALARRVQAQVSSIGGVIDVKATLLAPASPPATPSSPNRFVDVLAGAALGVLLAAVLFVLRR